MENTKENKLKFFAQYYKQNRARVCYPQEEPYIGELLEYTINHTSCLVLRDLKSITKEEAIKCWDNDNYIVTDEDVEYVSNLFHEMSAKNSDYLRSRGFAIDWLGLNVETLIEWGWIKIEG